MEELWKQVRARLRERIGDDEYHLWIKPLKIDAFSMSKLVIVAPNKFFLDWVEERYHSTMRDIMHEIGADTASKIMVADARPNTTAPETVRRPAPAATVSPGFKTNLNARYTFDNFVVGKYNQFAHAASLAVAQMPASTYNPLFIYGGTGLGKTHLLTAVGNYICDRSSLKVYYVSSEDFTNELISAIRFKNINEFREKYRHFDALLIDDIQFIAGREAIQEEFFHTFNTLHESHRQLILTSDKFPKEIPGLEERLRSRFEWGLIADMAVPDEETKVAILQRKAEEEHITLPEDVTFFLASQSGSNIRALEGYLVRLSAYASFTGRRIDLEMAQDILKNFITVQLIGPEAVQKAVCSFYHLTLADLTSPKRNKEIAWPRQVAMYLCRKMTSASLKEIGRAFGGKDHSTVVHAVNKVRKLIEAEEGVGQEVGELERQLKKMSEGGG